MNSQKDFEGTTCTLREIHATSSSNYSTCSDNFDGDINFNKQNVHVQTKSTILAGYVPDSNKNIEAMIGESVSSTARKSDLFNGTNFSINPLDQNLDALSEENDVFMDCTDISVCNATKDESTQYLPLEPVLKLSNLKENNYFYKNYFKLNKLNKSVESTDNAPNNLVPVTEKSEVVDERLVTILEETEVTRVTNSSVKKLSSNEKTGELLVKMIDEVKKSKTVDDFNKKFPKRVLFANKNNIINNENGKCKRANISMKLHQKSSVPLAEKTKYCLQKNKDINENCGKHNTTESFLMWERYCEASEKLSSRRSFSYTELNSVNESYGGDDEYSSSFKTLDDTYLSKCSLNSLNENHISQRCSRRKSMSCDSILQEVKHLPHLLYDRFLKCLAKEIEKIRKQNVVCTCQRINKKNLNKENSDKNSKISPKLKTKIPNGKNHEKDSKVTLKVSPSKTIQNRTRLSPEPLLRKSCQNRLSPESLHKLSSPTRRTEPYSWHKKIVSPVGEYIRGERKSPFKSSPVKKV